MNSYQEGLGKMLVENDCVKTGMYRLFEDRSTPYIIDFERALGRANPLARLADMFHSKMTESGLLSPDKPPFLIGNTLSGIPMAAAVAIEAYKHGQGTSGKGLDMRFGFFVKDEDIMTVADAEETRKKLLKEYPGVKVLNTVTVRPTELRGEDLLTTGRLEAARILNFHSDVESIVASGYSGAPLAVSIAMAMRELGKDPYIAYERFSGRTYEPKAGSFFLGDVGNKSNVVIVRSSDRPATVFYGNLQDNDNVLIVDDIAARESTLMGTVRKTVRQNPRATITGALVGVDKKEREGEKRLADSLRISGMDLYSIITAEELLEMWHQFPDPEKRLSDEQHRIFLEYQRTNGY